MPRRLQRRECLRIRQGVAIGVFVKKGGVQKKIHHAELWGLREKKYDWLEQNDISTTKWREIHPKSPFYLFVPRDEALLDRYHQYPKLTNIFPLNGVGMTTARDDFVIDLNKSTLLNRIRLFKHSKYDDEELHRFFEIRKKKGWSIRKAHKMLQEVSDGDLEKHILPVLYRPFDTRWIIYHDAVVWRTVKRVMAHMLGENIGLCIGRAGQVVGMEQPWNVVYCAENMTEFNLFYRGGNVLIPLYQYQDSDKKDLFIHPDKTVSRKPNLKSDFIQALSAAHGSKRLPEVIFHYVYAVLFSPSYRTKYAEFLKTDFPRVPFTKDRELFEKLAALGKNLVDFHLLKSSVLDKPVSRFQGKGDNRVEKQSYGPKEKRVYINKTQYFEGVEPEVWEYQIGGYQVLDKWLKDRKKRILNLDDIKHYCRVVTALAKTIEIQGEIDGLYREAEKAILSLSPQ